MTLDYTRQSNDRLSGGKTACAAAGGLASGREMLVLLLLCQLPAKHGLLATAVLLRCHSLCTLLYVPGMPENRWREKGVRSIIEKNEKCKIPDLFAVVAKVSRK